MKNLFFYPMFLLLTSSLPAQQKGKITAKTIKPAAGVENNYEYQPPNGLLVPDKAKVSIIYFNKETPKKTVPLTATNDTYEFAFRAPDSTDVLIIAILDEYDNVIDNNNEQGYVSYLYDNRGKIFASAQITQATLFRDYASFYHKTKVNAQSFIKMYEEGFKINPGLKKGPEYVNYLSLLYRENKDVAKPLLLSYAKQTLVAKDNESNWVGAYDLYRLLKMEQDQKNAETKILNAYPQGEFAKQKFWSNFRKKGEPTEQTYLAIIAEYEARFKINSGEYYLGLIDLVAKRKDWNAVLKYSSFVCEKIWLASAYNEIAWELSGGNLTVPGTDLEFAKIISKLSVDFVEEEMRKTVDSDKSNDFVGAYIGYTDTYALILYKLNNFDSAFYYQHAILERGPMGVEGMERYAAYAEKSKGPLFAKDFIEPQLLSGINSIVMQQQLRNLYKQLNLSEDEYLEVKRKSEELARKKTADKIIAKLGTQKGAEFGLKDLEGNTVSLSSLKGKVVVLDFWATWCGPCRASFPAMQELVNKYREDKEVVFLFIDTWEQKDPKSMLENASKFIKKNNYSFMVLLDEKDRAVGDYKVEGIPAKFVIDRKGNIVFMGDESNDLSLVVEAAKGY